ncbi:MAG: hypothetical protein H7Z37_11570 [Pyrinomonadaceae bacterium]|nr:hypothetical protein [Pyrinomonadaceae bacterium]
MTILTILVSFLTYLPSQEAKPARTFDLSTQKLENKTFNYLQSETVQESLIREAEKGKYVVHWVDFSGNPRTRDYVLRRNILLHDGYVFTREDLIKSLINLNKLRKIIYPVDLNDVTIRLDRQRKIIDMTIRFREKPKFK